jgi:hypothetical protein
MPLTNLINDIRNLGDPESMNTTEELCRYTENLELLLCDTWGFNIIDDWICIEVDDHGEALRETQFSLKGAATVIAYRFRQHPDWSITEVYRPYFMNPVVVTKYVKDGDIF